MNYFIIIDAVTLILGIYIIFVSLRMKKSGKIESTFVAEYEQSIDKLNELVRGGTTAMRLSLHKKYVSSLQQDIYRIKGLMAHKREEIENQLQKVIDATKEVSKLEKLEEKQLEEYRYASQKEQEQIIEEFVTNGSSNGGNTP